MESPAVPPRAGHHFVVADGFTKDEKFLIVADPDPDTDTANTGLCTGIHYDKGGGPGNAPPYKFGDDYLGEFTGNYLCGFGHRGNYAVVRTALTAPAQPFVCNCAASQLLR
jgi:hypothetical protein